MADKRQGIPFQNFVAQIEHAYATNGNVIVESPKFITDMDSGSRREFDVFITATFGAGHQATTAIEVKDKGGAIGVPEVEAFLSKCGRNNISCKVMVSPKGANAPALQLAAKHGVTIITMAEAEKFDWIAITALTEHRRTFGDSTFHVEMAPGVPTPDSPFELLDEAGDVVTAEVLASGMHRALPFRKDDSEAVGPHSVLVNFTDNFSVRLLNGDILPVARVQGESAYTVEVKQVPFAFHTYTGDGAGKGIDLSFASADVRVGPHDGKMVLARREDGTTDVSWQIDPEAEKAMDVKTKRSKKDKG
ncbi:restriction endonuclease [Caulobacter sp. DWP3-1-3b2]|uniref:restriction endonuclease n=1 Tax=Caulobacter sp. DWP3-1-3b2 TaxID=2804643 RepID=UPI003CEBD8CB